MIGNDVVDLQLAKIESNWQRIGFLDKIFTKNEQTFLLLSENIEISIWNLWSRKEAAYKIWNRQTGIRKFNPIQFECKNVFRNDVVEFENIIYFTKTQILENHIHSIAVTKKSDLSRIRLISNNIKISKENNIPFLMNKNKKKQIISKSHHGKFEFIVGLRNS